MRSNFGTVMMSPYGPIHIDKGGRAHVLRKAMKLPKPGAVTQISMAKPMQSIDPAILDIPEETPLIVPA